MSTKRFAVIVSVVLSVITSGCHHSYRVSAEVLDLSGTWKFQLDPDNAGMTDKWFNTEFDDSVHLPGTTDENLKGILIDEKAEDRLSRVWYWKGAASWYRDGYDREVFMETGKVYQIKLTPMSTSSLFEKGHRIRIEVSSSNFPRFDWNLNTGGNNYDESVGVTAHNIIHHSREFPSAISLPVVRR